MKSSKYWKVTAIENIYNPGNPEIIKVSANVTKFRNIEIKNGKCWKILNNKEILENV